jgi:hypothetical protein
MDAFQPHCVIANREAVKQSKNNHSRTPGLLHRFAVRNDDTIKCKLLLSLKT